MMQRAVAWGAATAALVAGEAVPAAGTPGLAGAVHCNTPQCTIPVTVKRPASSQRCVVSVNAQVVVTSAVQTIVWRIGSADFRFDTQNGISIRNDPGDFRLLASASGREFKLKFEGQGHSRTYDYGLNIVSVGDNAACTGPGEGPQPFPRIKNE